MAGKPLSTDMATPLPAISSTSRYSAQCVSGVAMSVLSGLPAIVFQGVGSLPADFNALPPRAVHGIVAKLLMLLIALHIVAALYHQFVRRDGLLSRMGFGRR